MKGLTFNPQSKHLLQAKKLWSQSFYDGAVEEYRRALKREPKNLAVKIEAAKALGLSYYHTEAEHILEKLGRLAKFEPMLLVHAGLIARDIRRPKLAEDFFKRALEKLPTNSEVEAELAHIAERRGDLTEAEERINKAIAKDPGTAWFQILKARITSQLGKSTGALKLYQEVIEKRSLPHGLKARALMEKATLHENLGQFDRSLECIESGKVLIRPDISNLPTSTSSPLAKARSLGDELSASFLQTYLNQQTEPPEKLCFLLGFPRSGTTLIEKCLSQSMQIDDAEELDIFGSRIHPIVTGTLQRYDNHSEEAEKAIQLLRSRYLEGVESALGGRKNPYLLDKNPSNTALALSCARVFPEAKFLTVLRDPRDILVSAYMQALPLNPESALFVDRTNLANHIVATLEAWLEAKEKLPIGSWREVKYEDFVNDPDSITSSIHEWLDADALSEIDEERSFEGASGYVHSPSFTSVRKAPHKGRVARWRNYEPWVLDLRPVLEPLMEQLGYPW